MGLFTDIHKEQAKEIAPSLTTDEANNLIYAVSQRRLDLGAMLHLREKGLVSVTIDFEDADSSLARVRVGHTRLGYEVALLIAPEETWGHI